MKASASRLPLRCLCYGCPSPRPVDNSALRESAPDRMLLVTYCSRPLPGSLFDVASEMRQVAPDTKPPVL